MHHWTHSRIHLSINVSQQSAVDQLDWGLGQWRCEKVVTRNQTPVTQIEK
jgi:hypothetical protein